LIQKSCEDLGIGVNLETDDDRGAILIEGLNGQGDIQSPIDINSIEDLDEKKQESSKGFSFNTPKISFPKIKIPKIGFLIFLLLVIVGLYFGFRYFEENTRNAVINIIVDSQELTRSLTIKVRGDSDTSVEKRTLKGEAVTAEVEDVAEIETTGEKIVGEKAGGEIKLFNNTDDDKNINEGTVLYYDDYEYEIVDSVELPAYTYVGTNPDGNLIFEPGEVEAEIIARDIGPDYNFDEDEDLDVDDYDDSDIYARSTSDIDGGKLDTLQVVSQEDIDALKDKIAEQSKKLIEDALKRQVTDGKKLIKGSELTEVTKETFSHELEEETDKLTLTQTIQARALVYVEKDVEPLVDELVKDLIPEGFELSDKEKEINVEVLGNTTDSVLNETEADIQVSVKSFVIAMIDIDSLRERLRDKTYAEAQEILKEIPNVKNFSLEVFPNIQLFNTLPKNKDNIEITVERQ
jgi:hypothetical protein